MLYLVMKLFACSARATALTVTRCSESSLSRRATTSDFDVSDRGNASRPSIDSMYWLTRPAVPGPACACVSCEPSLDITGKSTSKARRTQGHVCEIAFCGVDVEVVANFVELTCIARQNMHGKHSSDPCKHASFTKHKRTFQLLLLLPLFFESGDHEWRGTVQALLSRRDHGRRQLALTDLRQVEAARRTDDPASLRKHTRHAAVEEGRCPSSEACTNGKEAIPVSYSKHVRVARACTPYQICR